MLADPARSQTEKIPKLEEVLRFCAGRNLRMNVEVKDQAALDETVAMLRAIPGTRGRGWDGEFCWSGVS